VIHLSPTTAGTLRERFVEDMTVRGFTDKTSHDYIRTVAGFAAFLKRSPSTATAEDIRRFQIHQFERGMNAPAMNSAVAALRFFFNHTADRPDLARKLLRLRYPRKLPIVLSPDEAARLIAATTCLKHRAALSVAYGAGLRVAEVASLKVGDIDSKRMLIVVERGKGGRGHHALLSPDLLALLRAWWQEGRQDGVMLPAGWLFPGQDPAKPITTRQLSRVVEAAAIAAGLTKNVSPHTLRHSFATHLLEDGVDIRVIQVLLGHAKLDNTALYTRVATKVVRTVTSPLDKITAQIGAHRPPIATPSTGAPIEEGLSSSG
jgi:integrase/recombinase XerD